MQTNLDFTAPHGVLETVAPGIRRIIARNAGPYTFHGTGTYVIGTGAVAVVDPGPDDAAHVGALLQALAGETVTHVLVTHTHLDHSPAAAAVKRATGAPTFGFGPHGAVGETGEAGADLAFVPDVVVADGSIIEGASWRVEAVHTPGHTSNHLCFALMEEKALFSGDHVMGWSTTVIAPPDGDMAAYMRSLERLRQRADLVYWPTHGGPINEPRAHVEALIAHRRARREKVRAALGPRPMTPAALVPTVYPGLDPRLVGGAARSLLAHLIELRQDGLAVEENGAWRAG